MKSKIKMLLTRLLNSFDNVNKNSFSARKLTAFAFMINLSSVTFGYIYHAGIHKYIDIFSVLTVYTFGAFVCLGLVTIPELIKLLKFNSDKKKQNEQ